MRILVTGVSGFVGNRLCSHLKQRGHAIVALRRGKCAFSDSAIFWNPEKGEVIKEAFEGFDAVIHLAGEPLISSRWTPSKRKKILFSRTVGTWLLSQVTAQLLSPPKVFLSASAIGYYGNRGEELLTEESPAGNGFLASVCCEWEKATQAIEKRGARTLQMRFGMILGSKGGALQRLLPLYRLGFGAKLGSGNQWVSWIALTDLLCAIEFLLQSEALEGPVNFTSPCPVRQKEFSQTLAKILHRPSFLSLPKSLLRLVFGLAAEEMLLASSRVEPTKLQAAGFSFRYPFLTDAIKAALD